MEMAGHFSLLDVILPINVVYPLQVIGNHVLRGDKKPHHVSD